MQCSINVTLEQMYVALSCISLCARSSSSRARSPPRGRAPGTWRIRPHAHMQRPRVHCQARADRRDRVRRHQRRR